MKLHPMTVAALLGALVCGTAFSQQEGGGEELEKRVAELERSVEVLREELADARALVDDAVAYERSRSRASKEMMAVFTSAEQKGYTAGINFESRAVLLGGWRKYMASAQQGLPGAPPPVDPDAGRR